MSVICDHSCTSCSPVVSVLADFVESLGRQVHFSFERSSLWGWLTFKTLTVYTVTFLPILTVVGSAGRLSESVVGFVLVKFHVVICSHHVLRIFFRNLLSPRTCPIISTSGLLRTSLLFRFREESHTLEAIFLRVMTQTADESDTEHWDGDHQKCRLRGAVFAELGVESPREVVISTQPDPCA